MKKVSILFAALAIVGTMSFSSCKKCSTCTATDKTTGATITSGVETCGKKSVIDDYEAAFKTAYGTAYNVTCE